VLAEAVAGWRVGDRIIVTATTRQNKVRKTFRRSVRDAPATEERFIRALSGTKVTLDRPLDRDHLGGGAYRGEVANLSRNVIVESADPRGVRGHTMYHRHSAGAISYAEFRHLGKEGVLGRYSLHYHLAGDTLRGSSVIGASIWDSANRWLTIHGTNYLVVRDCVGYQSVGHGFFFEDGTEVDNVIYDAEYGLWRAVYERHAYRGVRMKEVPERGRNFFPQGKRPAEADFPGPLKPVDDLPPTTVITHVDRSVAGKVVVRGTTADNGTVKRVLVNGRPARALRPNFAQWEAVLEKVRPGELKVAAHAEDSAGNVEKLPHVVRARVPGKAPARGR
jgi:hypothetical protein